MKQVYHLVHEQARKLAAKMCFDAPDKTVVTFSDPVKSREQEEKYHAMIRDISKQALFLNQKFSEEDWKLLLLDVFAKARIEEGRPLEQRESRLVPDLNKTGFVQLGIQSRDLKKKEASEFIEYLLAFGAMQEPQIKWTNNEPDQSR